jgi:hypothetical protein
MRKIIQEASQLIETAFEFTCEFEDAKLFRKDKRRGWQSSQEAWDWSKELGMGIEPQSKWRHRQINSFFAALFPFFLFVNYSSATINVHRARS